MKVHYFHLFIHLFPSSSTGIKVCSCEVRNLYPYPNYRFRIRVESVRSIGSFALQFHQPRQARADARQGLFINYVVAFFVCFVPSPPYCGRLRKIGYPLPPSYLVNAKTPPP